MLTCMVELSEASAMEDLLAEIERAVRTRGWSARQASMMAVGTPELIRDMRRGRVPSVERFRALCDVLGLEFYVGPPRDDSRVRDLRRLERAIYVTENVLAATERNVTLEQKAQVVSAVYHLIGENLRPLGGTLVINLIDLAVGTQSGEPIAPIDYPLGALALLPKDHSIRRLAESRLRALAPRQ